MRYLALALIALVTGSACATQYQVDISGFAFNPKDITVRQGDTVQWTNLDAIMHTSTSGVPLSPDGVWESGDILTGKSFSFTFNVAGGTYKYYCRHHPTMLGRVMVVAPTTLTSPAGFLNPGWNWFSLPLPPLKDAVVDIFSPYNPENRLYRWDPVAKTILLYPNDFTSLDADESYVFLSDSTIQITEQGFPTDPGYAIEAPSAGWMWIGFPKTGPVPLTGVTVHNKTLNQTRTATVDFNAPDSWLNWNWLFWNSTLDSVQILGLSGADDDHARLWQGYRLWANVGNIEVIYPEP